MTVTAAPPTPTAPSPRRADRVAVVALLTVVLLLAGVGAWLFAVTPPTPAQGSTSGGEQGLVADGDSLGQTRWLLEPGTDRGTLLVSLRNDSRWTMTVSTDVPDAAYRPVRATGLWLTDPRGGFDPSAPRSRTLEVPPGREAGVALEVGSGCATYGAGSAATAPTAPLRVSALGKRAVRELPLPVPVTIVGPRTPGPDCPPA